MSINFHQKQSASYATRKADSAWIAFMRQLIDNREVDFAADIGCGGGIYTRALITAGIRKVIGIDFSEAMLASAKESSKNVPQVTFKKGEAVRVPLPDQSVNLVLERALIHHLKDIGPAIQETHRLLQADGLYVIQDRTAEDCFIQGSSTHIRGYVFDAFPHLAEIERNRRPTNNHVKQQLHKAGFVKIDKHRLWEARKRYKSKEELFQDIRNRTGRSLLHELSDEEIVTLIRFMNERLEPNKPIIEKDRWTIWTAKKGQNLHEA